MADLAAPFRRRPRLLIVLAAAVLVAPWLVGRTDDCLQGHGVAIDGDTLRLPRQAEDPPPEQVIVRVWGIDSPEMHEPGGPEAADALDLLLAQVQVTCCTPPSGQREDRYGRVVALCRLPDGRDIAMELVQQGHAVDWPRYSGGYYGDL